MAFDEHILSQADTGKGTAHTSSWEEVPWIKPMPDAPAMWRFSTLFKKILFWNRSTTGGWPAMKGFPHQILLCAVNPLILWVLILNLYVFGGMVVTSTTYISLLMSPPYNFTFTQIGLVKASPFLGALLAYPASGILTEYLAMKLARHNKGVHEHELCPRVDDRALD